MTSVPFAKCASAFKSGISHIVNLLSQPKMSRIHAGGVVACGAIMQNPHAFWNGSEVENPTDAVSVKWPQTVASRHTTVSVQVFEPRPNPAGIGKPNLGKESGGGGWRKSLRLQVLGRNLLHRLVICPVGLLARRAFLISLILAIPASVFSQGFTPRRPFVLTSGIVSNQTPEQLASYGLALRWVASDLGTNSLNVNTWTDRMQSAVWRMDDSTYQPAYTTNNGVAFNLTHRLTNNTFSPYFNSCCNCCAFGFIMDVTSKDSGSAHVYPPLICNSLPGGPSGTPGGTSTKWGFDNAHYGASKLPLAVFEASTEQVISTADYTLTNVWHDLIAGTYWTNTVTAQWMYEITNGFFYITKTNVSGATTDQGWGMPGDTSLGYSNFPTSLGYDYYRDSSPTFYLKELWIWTNNYYPVGPLMSSIVTNFHIYATNTYGYTP